MYNIGSNKEKYFNLTEIQMDNLDGQLDVIVTGIYHDWFICSHSVVIFNSSLLVIFFPH